MGHDMESSIIDAEFALSGDLESHHTELLTSSSSRRSHVKVDVFDVQNDESSEELTAALGSEQVLPVMSGIDLVGTHRMDINDMDCSGDLVDKDEGADSTEDLAKFGRQNDQIFLTDGGEFEDVGVLIL